MKSQRLSQDMVPIVGATSLLAQASSDTRSIPVDSPAFSLVVHGGSGTITRATVTPELEAQYRSAIERALLAGHAVLHAGGSSTDAVVAAIRVFEDDPLFNAGKGAVFTSEGKNELDASIMDGKTHMAGAVSGVTTAKNPIVVARAVMDKSKHVMLASAGADAFVKAQKLEQVDPSYFFTQHRWDQLQSAQKREMVELDFDGKTENSYAQAPQSWEIDHKYGTVGAVALDRDGNLAAGTSTGGLTNKLYGRVGDAPVIGAGTYADNATVAISCTGTGEFFMRGLVAYDVAARMKYSKLSVSDAVDQTIQTELTDKNGRGGLIALDAKGNIKFGFNTEGMYRGYIQNDGKPVAMVYRD